MAYDADLIREIEIEYEEIRQQNAMDLEARKRAVFAKKYKRKEFYDNKRLKIRKILRDLCNWKGINIIQSEVCVEHIYIYFRNTTSFTGGFLLG